MLALVGSQACYCLNDVATKFAAKTMPLGELLLLRGLLTIVLMALIIVALGQWRHLRAALTVPVGFRSLFEVAASGLYVAALIHMPIANAAAMVMMAPLILTALSTVFYAEPVGWRRWTAVVVGFAGVLCIVKPVPSAFDAWAILGLGAAFGGASRDLMTRRIGPGLPTLVIAFMSTSALTVVGGVIGLGEQWQPVGTAEFNYLAIAAVFFSGAVYFVVLAFRGVDFAVVAPFRYTFLLFAEIAGFFVFRELPDGWSAAGATLIVGSGLYALHREAVRRRALIAATPLA